MYARLPNMRDSPIGMSNEVCPDKVVQRAREIMVKDSVDGRGGRVATADGGLRVKRINRGAVCGPTQEAGVEVNRLGGKRGR
jgi:hypothetical protein